MSMSTPIKSSAQAPPDRFSGGADELTIRVRAVETDGALSAVEIRMPSGGGPPVLHRHDSFEFYRVQRGELTFYIEDDRGTIRRHIAGTGTLVPISSGREHTIRRESVHDAGAFVISAPAGRMEKFVRAAAGTRSGPRTGNRISPCSRRCAQHRDHASARRSGLTHARAVDPLLVSLVPVRR